MGFVAPYWLALSIPALFLIWRFAHYRLLSNVLRSMIALLFIGALAQPYWKTTDPGRHVMLVVDRSLSMPADHEARALESIRLLEADRQPGDALGILSFGTQAHLERQPSDRLRFGGFDAVLDAQASDLAGAIEMALDWIPEDRQGSLLILSDGEATGRDPIIEGQRAASRGVRIDAIPSATTRVHDTAVDRFALPATVYVGEPFQFEAWISTDQDEQRIVELKRDGQVISRATRDLVRGANRMLFRDLIPQGGVASYTLEAAPLPGAPNDARPQNDRGLGAVRVAAPPRVLVLNEDGATDTLVSILQKANIPVDVRAPEDLEITRLNLTRYRAVILENVAASRVGYTGMQALQHFVVERGGGLWMTGGKASFGIGGYHLSPIDEVLPVASDMRSESRKIGLALGLVLDRSGSMAVEVGPGMSKMDLANNGAIAAIDMLTSIDSVTVFAVDTQAHEIVPRQPVENFNNVRSQIAGIRSQGGGIFTHDGLLAAGQSLEQANQINRHIILFADAADAEQHEGVQELIGKFQTLGITVSVIALGTEDDMDAPFLKDVAAWGGGEAYFTTEPRELPRLFAQDTMTMARTTFIEERRAVSAAPGLLSMSAFGLKATDSAGLIQFPALDGYNQVHPRPETSIGATVLDETQTPLLASAQRGAGRAVSYAGQIGGTYGQDFLAWPEAANLVVSVTRYLLGQDEPNTFYATSEVVGQDAMVRIEVDPREQPDTSRLDAHITTADGVTHVVPLHSVDANRYEARLPLLGAGVALGSIHLASGAALDLPPMALPYSPEYNRRQDPEAGRGTLEGLARTTGGSLLSNLALAFEGPRLGDRWRVMGAALFWCALALLLIEIAVRRLDLFAWSAARTPLHRWIEPAKLRLTRGKTQAPKPSASQSAMPPSSPPPPATKTTPPPALTDKGASSMEDALTRARKRAGRRLDRDR